MNNRVVAFFTVLVILGMLVLFVLNVKDITSGQPPNQTYLKYNDIQGMAIEHQRLLYTLNFEQQNRIVEILNNGVPITEIKEGNKLPANFDKLVIYRFQGQPDIVLTPIAYVDKDLVFSAPDWAPNGYFMELSDGNLKTLLAQTYD